MTAQPSEHGHGPVAATGHLRVFLRQLPFTVVVTLIAGAFVVFQPEALGQDLVAAGFLLALAATGLSTVLPWHRLDKRWAAVIPLLDILAIGLLHHGGVRSSVVLVLPVLWMSTVYRATGVAVSVVASTVAAWGPHLIDPHIEAVDTQALFLLPVALAAIGVSIHLAERRSSARQFLLGRQGRLMEEVLEDSRRQQRVLEGILNTIDVGVVALGADGRIGIINRAHADLVGGRLHVGDHGRLHGGVDGYAGDGRTPLGTEGSPLVRAGRGETIDRELTWWDQGGGQRVALRVSASPLLDEGGHWAGAVIAYQDLTAEMAALKQREDFVSSVSHELRTPLTSIVGYLDLLMDDPGLSQEARDQLGVIERNADRLLGLISDLLTAGQIGRGELTLSPSVVDLCELVAESVQALSPRAAEHQVQVVSRAEASCRVRGDRVRMGQVVDNVLSNAIKYSRPGGHVEIDIQREDGQVVLWVRDDGIGIDAEDQQQLFTRFHRAGAVRNSSVQGVGLGLHISREIMEAHGGTVALRSEPGKGTQVAIIVPATAGEDE